MFSENGRSVGFFAISKTGHDKNETYAIVAADSKQLHMDGVYVANGKNRTIEKPKRKNIRHLAVTSTRVPAFESLMKGETVSSNLKLAKLIKEFNEQRG